MPRLSRPVVVVLAAGLLLAAGCQKLNKEMDVEFPERLSAQFRIIDGFRSDKKVTVNVTSEKNPVLAAVILEAQFEEIKAAEITGPLFLASLEKDALAISREPSKDITLTATIPAKKDFRICIYSQEGNKVHLKVTSD
jgi:hypothetical protein